MTELDIEDDTPRLSSRTANCEPQTKVGQKCTLGFTLSHYHFWSLQHYHQSVPTKERHPCMLVARQVTLA